MNQDGTDYNLTGGSRVLMNQNLWLAKKMWSNQIATTRRLHCLRITLGSQPGTL